MNETRIRAWRSHLQGLDGSLVGKSAGEVLARSGWARSVGGVGPYLTLFARAGISREAVDVALAKMEIHELPSARGCTYVVPASDFALALTVGRGSGESSDTKLARKLGATDREIEKLHQAILSALGKGPLTPDELRASTGGAVRNLGPEGKAKGLTTTLPLALGQLQSAGQIRRVPINGRLDQQRYRYALWQPNPLAKFKVPIEAAFSELGRRFFSWIGPATPAEFQAFSGLGVKACRAALEPLKLVPIAPDDSRVMFAEDRDRFERFQIPRQPHYQLVSKLDSLVLLRGDIKSLLAPEDVDRRVAVEKGEATAGGLADLPSHAIVDRGRLIGLWEYDVTTESIVWLSFGIRDKALEKAVARTAAYVRANLGDARSFSLDSPQSRVPRIEALRKAAATRS